MKLFKQTGRLTTSSAMVLILLPAMTMLSACGNGGGVLPTSSLSEIAQLNRRLDDLTRQLEAARAEAAEANSLAEGALATAEVHNPWLRLLMIKSNACSNEQYLNRRSVLR